MKRICYVLSYRAPDYIRTRSILAALRDMDGIDLEIVINRQQGLSRYVETLQKLIKLDRQKKQDIFILGFRGHEIYWPVRWLIGNRPIIFDAMMSPYSALNEESKSGAIGRVLSKPWKAIEASILHNAEIVLTDTKLHATHFSETFGLPEKKIHPIPVGATTPIIQAHTTSPEHEFSVLFYGSFLPLHGMETIIGAASLLRDLPIRFDFIGGSAKQAHNLHTLCDINSFTRYTHQAWIPYERLISETIPQATVCLGGPFGNTPQACRVVTGKTSQFLALGKATIIGNIREDYGFIDRENCLLVEQGNAQALAESLKWCISNREKLTKIGKAGQEIYKKNLSIDTIRKKLHPIIKSL
ncbi:hypothetical protein [Geopseudomonas aromaticivorans]